MKRLSVRSWISIITFVLIGVVLFLSRHELAHAWSLLGRVDVWILFLLIPVVMIGYLAAGEMVFSYLRQKHLIKEVSIWTQMRMSLELNFVNHILPSGGVSGMSYMNWRLGKFGVPGGKATMAQAVRYIMGFASLIALLVIAVFLVTIDGHVNRWIILMSSTLVFLMIFVTVIAIALLSNPDRLSFIVSRLGRACNKIVRKITFGRVQQAIHPDKLAASLVDMHDDYVELMRDKRILLKPFLWGVFFTITEIAIFWIVFWALGSPVNPAPILIAQGLAGMVATFFATPGGAGGYEAIMVLFLAATSMASSTALAGVLLARTSLIILTIASGYVCYNAALKKYGKNGTPPPVRQ